MAKKENYIYYNGETLLLSDWTTQALMAKEAKLSEGYIRKLKFRTKHKAGGKTIDYREIPELNLTLVKK
jgi:hypothetical protein